jgi:hypothetical protein
MKYGIGKDMQGAREDKCVWNLKWISVDLAQIGEWLKSILKKEFEGFWLEVSDT